MDSDLRRQRQLIQSLRDSRHCGVTPASAELIETHISYVLLAGEHAYKIKKAVNLGFLDFSTLARRKHFCEEELRLNPRLAPGIYESVVPIGGSWEDPLIGGTPAMEYAVRMHRFSQACLLDRLLGTGTVHAEHFEDFAATLAMFHASVPRATPDQHFGTAQAIYRPVMENFEQIARALGQAAVPTDLHDWSENRFAELHPRLDQRREQGFIRECHGDLHLGNMLLKEGRMMAFDGIEFSAALRWIDTISEVAFLFMDLEERGRADLGWRFLNAYLDETGDHAGLGLLDFYLVYRALVRAKVAALRVVQIQDRETALQQFHGYVDYARQKTRPHRAFLAITHGLSGSGKTFVSTRLMEQLGAIRLRSDVERKRLAGLAPLEKSHSSLTDDLYSDQQTNRTYEHLAKLTGALLSLGFSVIVDASFLNAAHRQQFRALADTMKLEFRIVACRAGPSTLAARIDDRTRDASEATRDVLKQQQQSYVELASQEQAATWIIDTESSTDQSLARLVANLR
ncbi:MAG: AAA family ATPase [Chromatiales bacterium]|nr:AAA family ATPase [Chromatiales bacterium]